MKAAANVIPMPKRMSGPEAIARARDILQYQPENGPQAANWWFSLDRYDRRYLLHKAGAALGLCDKPFTELAQRERRAVLRAAQVAAHTLGETRTLLADA